MEESKTLVEQLREMVELSIESDQYPAVNAGAIIGHLCVSKSEELKPCPFCPDGGELFINGGVGCRWVECSSCGCEGPARKTEAEAIEAWNTRAERTCRYESTNRCTWVCTSCGMEVETRHYGYNYCPNCGAKVVE